MADCNSASHIYIIKINNQYNIILYFVRYLYSTTYYVEFLPKKARGVCVIFLMVSWA